MNMNMIPRVFMLTITILIVVMFGAGSVMATPFNYGEGVSPLKWPVGTRANPKVIKISIEDDANKPPDRSALLKEGMERWNAELASRGIQLEVSVRASGDAAPAGSVDCHYGNAGDSMDMDQGVADAPTLNGNSGLAGCAEENGVITAEILIKANMNAAGDDGKEQIRNLGAHEITHILGLADDDDGSVTDPEQGTEKKDFNDRDRSEIGTLYPVLDENNNKKDSKATANTSQETTTDGKNQYNYTFTYDTVDGEMELGHVTLITLGINPSVIDDIIAPPGWEVFNPADPAHLNPTYLYYQGYMEDGHPVPAPWDPNSNPAVAFRISTGEPLTYGNGLEGYAVTFSVIAKNDVLGYVEAWAGGPIQLLEGPVDIEPPPTPGQEVGGNVYPADKLTILAPWILLAAVLIVGVTIAAKRHRTT